MANLNKNQQLAVEHLDGPALVLAGPGSGKTRVIAHRINHMINLGIPPTRILAISFTKASSIDMKRKTLDLGNDDRVNKVNFGTFHSIFFRILRRYAGVNLEDLVSEADRYRIVKGGLKYLKIKDYSDEDVSDVLSEISLVKNELMNPTEYDSKVFENDQFVELYRLYENTKKNANKIDFDDMLIKTYILLKQDKNVLGIVRQVFRYILIDEFQDINRVQFEVIKLISEPNNNIFVVGDEDQSIYGFRGARPDFMIDFKQYFEDAVCIILETNYRSKKDIVDLSQKLIKNNKNRHNKEIKAFREEASDIRFLIPKDTDDEAISIAKEIEAGVNKKDRYEFSDFAVIYRTNRQARAFVDAFMDLRIPFILKDSPKSIYDHWVSMDIISYLKIASRSGDNSDWLRIINKPFRYIAKGAIKTAYDSVDFLGSLLENDDIKTFTKRNLEDLDQDLSYMQSLAPEYAISYIRTTLDYDRYILEYCHSRKIKSAQIVEILDELENSAKPYKSAFEFFQHIDKVRDEIKKNSEKTGVSENTEGVILSTMHSSKGLEFDNVYIAGVNDTVVPFIPTGDVKNSDIEEERRLLYVGMTRAKNELTISMPQRRFGKKIEKSRFVKELNSNQSGKMKKSKKKETISQKTVDNFK